jgi:hypothetical protein
MAPLSIWALVLGLILALAVAAELGYRLTHRAIATADDNSRSFLGMMDAAALGLLGLLLGFSFSMAAERFEARRHIVVDEANAIGTAHLRAAILPPLERVELRRELRQYLEVRLALHAAGSDRSLAQAAQVRLQRLQDQIWQLAATAASREPRAVTTGLLLQSINDLIDLDTKREVAFQVRVPVIIPMLLTVVAVISMFGVGCSCGLTRRRNRPYTLLLALSIAAVILVILDLDHPFVGGIRAPESVMTSLRERLAHTAE